MSNQNQDDDDYEDDGDNYDDDYEDDGDDDNDGFALKYSIILPIHWAGSYSLIFQFQVVKGWVPGSAITAFNIYDGWFEYF